MSNASGHPLQAVGLVGAFVTGEHPAYAFKHHSPTQPPSSTAIIGGANSHADTGTLARKRRQEIVEINAKLRQINAQLRLQSVDEVCQLPSPATQPHVGGIYAIRRTRM